MQQTARCRNALFTTVCLSAVCLALAASNANATDTYYDFTGVTTTYDLNTVGGLAPATGIDVGGYFELDTTTSPDQVTATMHHYAMNSPFGLHATEGNLVFVPGTGAGTTQVSVEKGPTYDRFWVDSLGTLNDINTHAVIFPYAEAFFALLDPGRTLLTDLNLPSYPLDLSKATGDAEFFLSGGYTPAITSESDPNMFGLNGTLRTLSGPVAVPEPTFYQFGPALVLGCLAARLLRRRFR